MKNICVVTIMVEYDETTKIPSEEELNRQFSRAIADGLLTPDISETVVKEYDLSLKVL